VLKLGVKMKAKMKQKSSNFASDAKRLAAIRKTAEEMAEPPGTDLQILVGEAIDAYWVARENAMEKTTREGVSDFRFVEETIALARAAAWQMVSPVREFFSDFFSTLAPAVVTLTLLGSGAAIVAVSGWNIPARWLPILTTVLPLILGTATVIVVSRQRKTVVTRWEFLTHSMGAVAGGAILAGLLLGYSAVQRRSRQIVLRDLSASSSALAQNELEELVISSMEQRHLEGAFLQTSSQWKTSESSAKILNFQTKSNVQQRAIYEVAARGLNGQLVADVTPTKGYLYYEGKGLRDLRSTFLYGKVQDVDSNGFSMVSDDDLKQLTKLSRGPLVPKPSVGDLVIVSIEPSTATAMKLLTITDRSLPTKSQR
jgi:hypothetical protein